MASLPDDFWVYEEASQSLIGKRTRLSFQLAQNVEVRLAQARPVTGGLIFNVIAGTPGKPVRAFVPAKKPKPESRRPERRDPKSKAKKRR
jgi:ribonuclease R